jgi:hypothetical protein
LVEPCRQPDAARNGVQFRNGQPRFGQQQIRTDDTRDFIFERRRALQRDEFSRLAKIQPACHPLGHFALGALAVEQIDRTIELKQHPTEGFNFLRHPRAKRKWNWGNLPRLTRKQTSGRKPVSDVIGRRGGLIVGQSGGSLHDSLGITVGQRC